MQVGQPGEGKRAGGRGRVGHVTGRPRLLCCCCRRRRRLGMRPRRQQTIVPATAAAAAAAARSFTRRHPRPDRPRREGTPQCFLLTPKLLSDLHYSRDITLLNIINGAGG